MAGVNTTLKALRQSSKIRSMYHKGVLFFFTMDEEADKELWKAIDALPKERRDHFESTLLRRDDVLKLSYKNWMTDVDVVDRDVRKVADVEFSVVPTCQPGNFEFRLGKPRPKDLEGFLNVYAPIVPTL